MELLNQLTVARAQGLFQQKTMLANCLSTDSAGKCVYITGPRSGLYQVTTAEPQDGSTKMPAIGVIIQKPTSVTCEVQLSGELDGLLSGFTPGRVLFVAVDGSLTHTIPTAAVGQLAYIQSMGVALSDDVVLVMPDFSIIKRQG